MHIFCNIPRLVHKRSVRRISKYLAITSTYVDLPDINRQLTPYGFRYKTNIEIYIKSYVDANFSGEWDQADSDNTENFMSRTGYIITYTGCPVLWCIKLQTEVTLITIEEGYISLRRAMHKVIPFIEFIKELYFIFDIHPPNPEVFCKLFGKNQICIAVVESNKF